MNRLICVLLLALDFCSTYCRYCTRSRVVGHGEISPDEKRLERAFEYIASNPQIRDVLISGGDPLAMADHKLDWLLTRLREIPHLEFVRLGTKMPAVLPQRITPEILKEVFGLDVTGEQLQALVRENIFLSRVAATTDTFIYHLLFRDFLRKQLEEETTEHERTQMHRRLADYYSARENWEPALHHFFEAGD